MPCTTNSYNLCTERYMESRCSHILSESKNEVHGPHPSPDLSKS